MLTHHRLKVYEKALALGAGAEALSGSWGILKINPSSGSTSFRQSFRQRARTWARARHLNVQTSSAANATPVKGEVDWAVPQTGAGHTAKVSHNLPETTKSVRLSGQPS